MVGKVWNIGARAFHRPSVAGSLNGGDWRASPLRFNSLYLDQSFQMLPGSPADHTLGKERAEEEL